MSNIINRVGEINVNNQGTPMKIINYRNSSDLDIEFQDKFQFVKKNQSYMNFKNGAIKNPYDRTVYGVGYLGVGRHKVAIDKVVTNVYKSWASMLERCYSENMKHRNEAYYGVCTVCDEWHNFQNFGDWFEENKYDVDERLHVEKDILFPSNKIYSPDKCLLVPQKINTIFKNKSNKIGLPNGITLLSNGKYRASYSGENLGAFDSIEEAYNVHLIKKKEHITDVANQYKNIITDKVYNALINYNESIENDKNYFNN